MARSPAHLGGRVDARALAATLRIGALSTQAAALIRGKNASVDSERGSIESLYPFKGDDDDNDDDDDVDNNEAVGRILASNRRVGNSVKV